MNKASNGPINKSIDESMNELYRSDNGCFFKTRSDWNDLNMKHRLQTIDMIKRSCKGEALN